MSLTIQQTQIVYKLNTNIVRVVGDIAYDANGNEVSYDLAAVNAYVTANEYKSNRVAEYPSIGDQLDALWKGGEAATEMLAKVQAVKTKYPKP
jgi:hypothetical protein